MHYNLGNASLKAGEKGQARVYYERALKAAPRDENLLWNMQILKSSLADRIEALAAERAATFELITMYYLSGDIRMHSSPTLKRHRAQFARLLRTQLLAHLPEVEPAVEAADLLTSVDGWLRLRRTQKLSVERARRVTIEALTALVPPA